MPFSDETFAELAARLMRARFDRHAEPALRRRFLADVAGVGEWVAISGFLKVCRDPADDKFLETAIAGEADCLVTGDGDLLALGPYRRPRILTASAFLEAR
jgi:putative PIN family toxin of toxin-antitoxin system